ncbi:hypothetical protein SynA1825c_00907 [Synechococcus sp. A18-25c]|nr:hypothetical protein SynA1825c_00907 [Synechococcus sp. A18-25c]
MTYATPQRSRVERPALTSIGGKTSLRRVEKILVRNDFSLNFSE